MKNTSKQIINLLLEVLNNMDLLVLYHDGTINLGCFMMSFLVMNM